jgi:hypothetical protein
VKPTAPVLKGQERPSSMALPPLYYEGGRIIPKGSRSEPGALMGVGPGPCGIRCSSTSFLNAQARFFA